MHPTDPAEPASDRPAPLTSDGAEPTAPDTVPAGGEPAAGDTVSSAAAGRMAPADAAPGGAAPGSGSGRSWSCCCVLSSFRSAVADWNDVPTGSMKPTILEGDRVFVNKIAYDLRVPVHHLAPGRVGEPAARRHRRAAEPGERPPADQAGDRPARATSWPCAATSCSSTASRPSTSRSSGRSPAGSIEGGPVRAPAWRGKRSARSATR